MATKTEPAENNKITIDGIGPIADPVTFAYPDGGIVELLGNHGAGKSTALRVINRMLGNEDDLSVNDSAQKGRAEGFGVVLTVAKSTRRTGEAAFSILEGRFSISDLADPQIDDPEAADRHRIKALVQLARAKADMSLFNDVIAPDAQPALLKPDTTKTDDLVTMAARIKRDLEAAARLQENVAENLNLRARALIDATIGVDVKQPHDSDALNQAHLEAISRLESLKAGAAAHSQASKKIEKAQEVLEQLDEQYKGPTVADATEAEVRAKCRQDETAAALLAARNALHAAEMADQEARNTVAAAIAARKTAEQHFEQRAQWEKTLKSSLPVCPDAADILNAQHAVGEARTAMENGAVIRAALAKHNEAAETNKKSADAAAEAKRLRESAKSVDGVLSSVVAKVSDRLRVGSGRNAGRLVLDTDRGEELFADLSDGERALESLHVAIKAVGKGGAIVIPQPYYDNLNRTTRQALDKELREAGVVGFTATCVEEGELRARTLN